MKSPIRRAGPSTKGGAYLLVVFNEDVGVEALLADHAR